jgi:hypothetical protein
MTTIGGRPTHASMSSRSSVVLPLCGAPTTRPWPASSARLEGGGRRRGAELAHAHDAREQDQHADGDRDECRQWHVPHAGQGVQADHGSARS